MPLFLVLYNTSYAVLTINIDKGIINKHSVAIVDFKNDFKNDSIPDGVTGVIRYDMAHNGRLIQSNTIPEKPDSLKDINWNKWNSDYIVIGKVDKGAFNTSITFDVIDTKLRQVVLSSSVDNIGKTQFRQVAHLVSDTIYKTVTDENGFFSSKIAYIVSNNSLNLWQSTYQLIVSDYDGFNAKTLITQKGIPLASPAWSSDGKYIAYVSYYDGGMKIYQLNTKTGKYTDIADYKGINSSPSYAPNGKYIAYASSKNNSENTNIYVASIADNNTPKALTINNINTAPAWSPDSNKIAFVSNRDRGRPAIYLTDYNSKYPASTAYITQGYQLLDPVYTHDGKHIIFMYQAAKNNPINIANYSIEDKKITKLTQGSADSSPTVSPDGSVVMYVKDSNTDHAKLALVSTDGLMQDTININTTGKISAPAWQY